MAPEPDAEIGRKKVRAGVLAGERLQIGRIGPDPADAAWYVLALVAVLFIGFETRGRTIDEIDSALTAKGPAAAPVKASAV